MVMIFARGARQWYSLQPRGNVGVWICGACGRLEASFHLVAQVMGAIVAALAAGFLPCHGPFSCSIDGHASSGDAAGLVMKMQQRGNL
jgi:hypothetical protein